MFQSIIEYLCFYITTIVGPLLLLYRQQNQVCPIHADIKTNACNEFSSGIYNIALSFIFFSFIFGFLLIVIK